MSTEPTARASWPIPGGFGMQCRCGTRIEVHVTIEGLESLADFAVTCDDCGTTHWIRPAVNVSSSEEET